MGCRLWTTHRVRRRPRRKRRAGSREAGAGRHPADADQHEVRCADHQRCKHARWWVPKRDGIAVTIINHCKATASCVQPDARHRDNRMPDTGTPGHRIPACCCSPACPAGGARARCLLWSQTRCAAASKRSAVRTCRARAWCVRVRVWVHVWCACPHRSGDGGGRQGRRQRGAGTHAPCKRVCPPSRIGHARQSPARAQGRPPPAGCHAARLHKSAGAAMASSPGRPSFTRAGQGGCLPEVVLLGLLGAVLDAQLDVEKREGGGVKVGAPPAPCSAKVAGQAGQARCLGPMRLILAPDRLAKRVPCLCELGHPGGGRTKHTASLLAPVEHAATGAKYPALMPVYKSHPACWHKGAK